MGLFISLKTQPQDFPQSQRQIEQWANGIQWKNLALSNATAFAGGGTAFVVPQYSIDGFGVVRLRGTATVNGTPPNGGTNIIATIPTPCVPKYNEAFAVASSTVANTLNTQLTILTNGQIQFWAVGSGANPYVCFSGVQWTVF